MYNFLCFIEAHSVLVGAVVDVVLAVALAIFGSFWYRKYIKKKRVDASLGFYSGLLLRISKLEVLLEVDEYTVIRIMYIDSIYDSTGWRRPDDFFKTNVREFVRDFSKFLCTTESNIPPKNSQKTAWIDTLKTLNKFLCQIELGILTDATGDNAPEKQEGRLSDSMNAIKIAIEK